MIRRRQPRRTRADDQYSLSGFNGGFRKAPVFRDRQIAQKTLDGVHADRAVDRRPVTRRFARMIADASVNGGHRIFLGELYPGFVKCSFLRQREPRLDVLASRTSPVAGREKIDVNRTLGSHGSRAETMFLKIRFGSQVGFQISHIVFFADLNLRLPMTKGKPYAARENVRTKRERCFWESMYDAGLLNYSQPDVCFFALRAIAQE